jgi:hypothetical protein
LHGGRGIAGNVFSQVGRDVPGPKIVKVAGLPAANYSYRLALEEIFLGVNWQAKSQEHGA